MAKPFTRLEIVLKVGRLSHLPIELFSGGWRVVEREKERGRDRVRARERERERDRGRESACERDRESAVSVVESCRAVFTFVDHVERTNDAKSCQR